MSEQLNICILTGRPTKDPEVSRNGETSVAHVSLAINRRKNKDGVEEADFPRVTMFGGMADFAEKWVRKGKMITVVCHVRTGKYENKDGETVYTTDFIADRLLPNEWPEKDQQDQYAPQDQYPQYAQQGQGWNYPQGTPYQPAQQPMQGMMPMPGEPYGRNNW